jgi:hypothetical protein
MNQLPLPIKPFISIENPFIYVPIRHSTNVENPLQINLFMQNKPNFRKAKMNINTYYTKAYKNETAFRRVKNKPNSNPNKPNFQKAKMNVNSIITKDYRKKDDFIVRINKPNSNPISVKPKMNANVYFIEDYENEPPSGPKKTNPNKPNLFTGQNRLPKNPAKHKTRIRLIFQLT